MSEVAITIFFNKENETQNWNAYVSKNFLNKIYFVAPFFKTPAQFLTLVIRRVRLKLSLAFEILVLNFVLTVTGKGNTNKLEYENTFCVDPLTVNFRNIINRIAFFSFIVRSVTIRV